MPTLLAPRVTNGKEGTLPITGGVCPALQSLAAQDLGLSLVSEEPQAAPPRPALRTEAEAEAGLQMPAVTMAGFRHLALTETRLWAPRRGRMAKVKDRDCFK